MVKGVSVGSTNITAEWEHSRCREHSGSGSDGSSYGTVIEHTRGRASVSILTLPSVVTDLNLNGTAQFLAYGTFSTAPTVLDVTNVLHAGFPTASCTAAYAAANSEALAADAAANLPVTNLPTRSVV